MSVFDDVQKLWDNKRIREAFAFAVSPLIPLSISLVIIRHSDNWIFAMRLYLVGLLIGIPAYIFLERRGITGLRYYLLTGALLALAVWLSISVETAWLFWPDMEQTHGMAIAATIVGWSLGIVIAVGFLIPALFLGAVCGAVFWTIVRPDKVPLAGSYSSSQPKPIKA